MRALTVSLIQGATHWHDQAANRKMFEALLEKVPDATNLVLLPEMFSTGFTMDSAEVAESMDGETVGWLKAQAERFDKAVCGSIVVSDAGSYFNRFLCALPGGELVCYDKRHLFRMAGEHERYRAGGEKIIFEVGGWRICPMVCYDLRFPVWFRNNLEYDALICVANWPARRLQAWNTLLRARAIENQVYVAAVNIIGTDGNGVEYAGGSAVYDPAGEVMAEVFDTQQIVTCVLQPEPLLALREEFPVWQDADDFKLDQ